MFFQFSIGPFSFIVICFIDYAHALSTTTSLEVIFLLILTFVLNCRPISDFILTSYMVHDTSFSLLSVNGPDAL